MMQRFKLSKQAISACGKVMGLIQRKGQPFCTILSKSLRSSTNFTSFASHLEEPYQGQSTIDFNMSKLAKQGRPIYMDVQATTPLDYRAADAMLPFLTSMYGNPHSKSHEYGWICEEAVEKARANIARLIKADPLDIIFTSGATESNNMSLKGLARFYGANKKHLITCVTVNNRFELKKGLTSSLSSRSTNVSWIRAVIWKWMDSK